MIRLPQLLARTLVVGLAAGAFLISSATKSSAQPAGDNSFSKYVDAKGNISLPDDFETTFVHLGTVAVAPKPETPVSELHSTYSRLQDIQSFQQTGHFADGAVLVKSVRSTKGEELSTGHARFAADPKVWFVLIKDSQGRFKGNELWGDGWGWALFNGDDRKKQVATDYRSDCRSCHVPAKGTDWIYTQCYPALQRDPAKAESSATEKADKLDLIARFPQWKTAVTLQGNTERGKTYFEKKLIKTSLTCAACHSFDARDTMQVDGDGLVRAGFPIFASAHRTNIKNSGTGLVALGANVCVLHFMKDPGPGMTAQELADMNSYLHSGGDAKHSTARNIDYSHLKWTIPDDLTGGDVKQGRQIAVQSCITCHSVDDLPARIVDAGGKIEAGSFKAADLKRLALRIRNPEYKYNDEMPGYSDLRLTEAALRDILAWLTNR